MRHLDDVTSADTGRRRMENQCECKSPFASLKRCQRLTAGCPLSMPLRLTAPDVFHVTALGPEVGEPRLTVAHGATGLLMVDGGEGGARGRRDGPGIAADKDVGALLQQ